MIGRLSNVLQRWFKITFKFELISGSFLFYVQLSSSWVNADLTERHNSSHWKKFGDRLLKRNCTAVSMQNVFRHAPFKGPIGVEIIFQLIRRTLQLLIYRDYFKVWFTVAVVILLISHCTMYIWCVYSPKPAIGDIFFYVPTTAIG